MLRDPETYDHRGTVLEICANSIQSALNAEAGHASRVELCQNLEAGGITPSYGMIARAGRVLKMPFHVLIRPRPGDFVYSEDEFQIMLEDIKICKTLGVAAVVVGVLTQDHRIDLPRTKELVDAAKPEMKATFSRAFDEIHGDLNTALDDVVNTGCTSLLTSGGYDANTAEEGLQTIKMLQAKVAHDAAHEEAYEGFTIMPGSGVKPTNATKIVNDAQVNAIHASALEDARDLSPEEKRLAQRFGAPPRTTSIERVKQIADLLKEDVGPDSDHTDHLYIGGRRRMSRAAME